MLLIVNVRLQDFKGARSSTEEILEYHSQEHRVLSPSHTVRPHFPSPTSCSKQRCALFPSTKVSIFFIINKTLSNAHSYKCFTLFAYSIRVINPKDRCQCNCWILQINLAAIKATNLSNGTVSQSQAVNWCEHRFKTDKDIYKNINQFGRQSQRYC